MTAPPMRHAPATSHAALTRLSVAATTLGVMKTRLAALLLLSASAVTACSSAGAASTPGATSPAGSTPDTTATSAGGAAVAPQQVSDANGVTVTATWGGSATAAVFEIEMDTHAGSLDSIDLAGAVLRNDRGQQLSGASWAAPAGGHHRSGKLTFAGDAAPVLQGAKWVELVLPTVGGVPERVLRWELRA